jgi:hypothetical protein
MRINTEMGILVDNSELASAVRDFVSAGLPRHAHLLELGEAEPDPHPLFDADSNIRLEWIARGEDGEVR